MYNNEASMTMGRAGGSWQQCRDGWARGAGASAGIVRGAGARAVAGCNVEFMGLKVFCIF